MLLNASLLLLIEMPGGGELLVILVVVLILFGGKKIPELMRGLGKGIREFNDAKENVTRELEEGLKEKEYPKNNDTGVNTHVHSNDSSTTVNH